MANTTKPVQNVRSALVKAILTKLNADEDTRHLVNNLALSVIGVAAELREGDDGSFTDAFMPEIHNLIQDSVTEAVKTIVDNWDAPEIDG